MLPGSKDFGIEIFNTKTKESFFYYTSHPHLAYVSESRLARQHGFAVWFLRRSGITLFDTRVDKSRVLRRATTYSGCDHS